MGLKICKIAGSYLQLIFFLRGSCWKFFFFFDLLNQNLEKKNRFMFLRFADAAVTMATVAVTTASVTGARQILPLSML